MRRTVTAVTALVLLTATACGSDTSTASTADPSASAGPATSDAAAPSASGSSSATGCVPSTAAVPTGVPALTGTPTDTTVEAKIAAGTAAAPTTLLTRDVVTCQGTKATESATVDVRYTGALYSDGTVFDASWKSGSEPISFPLSGVVPGFAQGIVGMAVGDRREIVIPPALGYGDAGSGPVPGGATIVFVVDLVGIS